VKRLRSHLVGFDQGSVLMFSDFEEEGPMWRSDGPREARRPVRFANAFLRPPMVHAAVEMWDFADGANLRADMRAEQVTREGFDLVFRTWGDTRVARIRAGWFAIGALRDPDDWEVDGWNGES
jgi:hypothetical protein